LYHIKLLIISQSSYVSMSKHDMSTCWSFHEISIFNNYICTHRLIQKRCSFKFVHFHSCLFKTISHVATNLSTFQCSTYCSLMACTSLFYNLMFLREYHYIKFINPCQRLLLYVVLLTDICVCVLSTSVSSKIKQKFRMVFYIGLLHCGSLSY
jgi:hypothetical protein